MSRGRTASRQRALARQGRAAAARPAGSGRGAMRSLEMVSPRRRALRTVQARARGAQRHEGERVPSVRAASGGAESAVAVPSGGALSKQLGFVESLAVGVAGATAAAGERVSTWGMQLRRWAGSGLVDAWPDDAYRLGDMLRVSGGMPVLAARAAWARAGRWLRLHAVVLTALVLCAALAIVGGSLAFRAVVASGALRVSAPVVQPLLSGRAQQVGPGIVLQPQATPTPTVALPAYMVGAWPSASAPSQGATMAIFVRVTDRASLRPVSGASVTLQVRVTCANPFRTDGLGPVATGADGIAAIPVRVSGMPGGQPVCVTAIVRAGGQVYTASATFAPQ